MKTIKTYLGMPILDVVKGIPEGKETDFGVYRDRDPYAGWGQVRRVNLELSKNKIREEIFTKDMKIKMLSDLAYVYGESSEIF